MKNSFSVSIVKGNVISVVDDTLSNVEVMSMLEFREAEIETILETHAAIQSYWEALALKMKSRYEHFTELFEKKWWAYNRVYAKHILASYGDTKPTVEAIRDMTAIAYSQDLSDAERKKYAYLAHKGSVGKKEVVSEDDPDFYFAMYKYLQSEDRWFFESVVETELKLKEDYDVVKVIAQALSSRSYHLSDAIDLLKAKRGNLGPMTVEATKDREIMKATSQYARKRG